MDKALMNLKEVCEYTGWGETKVREILKRPTSTFTIILGNRLYVNKKLFEDRYIVEGDKLVQLTKEVIDKYVNKKVKLRTIMYCKGGNHPCSKCVGEGWYKIGIRNIGLSSMKVASTMLNLNMKKFHNATADLYNLNINDLTV